MTVETLPIESQEALNKIIEKLRLKLKTEGVLVTRVTSDQQIVLAQSGTELPDSYSVSMPLSHSICQHSIAMEFPLAIDNTIGHPLLIGNKAHSDLQIVAYLGAPLNLGIGKQSSGAICVWETKERRWIKEEIAIIMDVANDVDKMFIQKGIG